MATRKLLATILILSMVTFFAVPMTAFAGTSVHMKISNDLPEIEKIVVYGTTEDFTLLSPDWTEPDNAVFVLGELSSIDIYYTSPTGIKTYLLSDIGSQGHKSSEPIEYSAEGKGSINFWINSMPGQPLGSIEVNKSFSDDFTTEVAFGLYQGQGDDSELIRDGITSGQSITFSGLIPGDYDLFELNVPDGYITSIPDGTSVSVEENSTETVYVTNTLIQTTSSASITLIKDVASSLSGPWNDTLTVSSLGPHIAYRFTVTNDGDYPLQNVTISDPDLSLSGVTLTSMPITIGALAVDETTTRSIECDLMVLPSASWNGNVFLNEATARGYYSVPTNNINMTVVRELPSVEDSDTAEVTYSPIINTSEAAILLDKTVAPDSVTSRDEEVIYTFKVTNEGDYTLYGVSVSDAAIGVLIYFDGPLVPEDSFTTTRAFDLTNLGTETYGSWDGDVFTNTAVAIAYYGQRETMISDDDIAQVTYNPPTERRTRRTTTLTEEPVPAAPVPIPEIVLDEPVPAAPLPKTGGLDPSFLYGLGALLAAGGLAIKRRKI